MSTETFEVPADCNTLEIWCRTRLGVFNAAMDIDLNTLDSTVFDTDRTSLQFRFVRVEASRVECSDQTSDERGTFANPTDAAIDSFIASNEETWRGTNTQEYMDMVRERD